jgi:6-phosphogluconolactonase
MRAEYYPRMSASTGESAPLQPYEVSQSPARPDLPGTVVVRETPDDVVDAIASDLMLHALNCVRSFGDFHLALSGGSTPLPLYRRLMYDPMYRDFPWPRTHVWIVDERRVGFDDERSNFKAINELIIEHSGIPATQVHPMFATSERADLEYEQSLRDALGWREKGQDRLDFAVLGMGGDGHTASLFPHSPALVEELAKKSRLGEPGHPDLPALVRINAGPTVTQPDRVTMTLTMLNACRFLGVIVTGTGKQAMVSKVSAAKAAGVTDASIAALPVLGLKPLAGELRWYLDHAACPGWKPSHATHTPSSPQTQGEGSARTLNPFPLA